MTLTRKQAICVLLGLPAAAQVAPKVTPPAGDVLGTENTEDWRIGKAERFTVESLVKTYSLVVPLADKDGDAHGIDGITVDYHGQTRRITAAEIWAALNDGVVYAPYP